MKNFEFIEEGLIRTNVKYGKNKKSFGDILFSIFFYTLLTLAIITFTFNLVFQGFEVVGVSMQPNFNEKLSLTYDAEKSPYKDIIFVNKFEKGNRGDIIVLKYTYKNEKGKLVTEDIVKRLIANSGDKLTLKKEEDGFFYYYVNDKKLNETYINTYTAQDDAYFLEFCQNNKGGTLEGSSYTIKIDEGKVFVLGDNRGHSTDSHIFGQKEIKDIVGKMAFSYKYNENLLIALWRIFISIFK